MRPGPLATLGALALCLAPVRAAHAAADDAERTDGPARVGAVVGQGGLTAALDADGTLTVLRWPNAGYSDHLHHRTAHAFPGQPSARTLERFGASATDGVVLGVVTVDASGITRAWRLDDAALTRRLEYTSDTSRTARLEATGGGLELTLHAWVPPDTDTLHLRLTVQPRVPLTRLSAFLLAHPAPCARRYRGWPVADVLADDPAWEDPNGFAAAAVKDARVLVSVAPYPALRGLAEAVAQPWGGLLPGVAPPGKDLVGALEGLSAVALAVGCDRPAAWQVGAWDDGLGVLLPRDAFADVTDGALDGSEVAVGAHTLGWLAPLAPQGISEVTFHLAVAARPSGALQKVANARAVPESVWLQETEEKDAQLALEVALPRSEAPEVRAAALRALVVLAQATDPLTGSVAAAPNSQPMVGMDRPVDAALVDLALAEAGLTRAAVNHRAFWAAQVRAADTDEGPAGSVPGGVYSDGLLASASTAPLDGLAATLWGHVMVARRVATEPGTDPTAGHRAIAASGTALLDALLPCAQGPQPCASASQQSVLPTRSLWQHALVVAALRAAAGEMVVLGEPDRAGAAQDAADALMPGLEARVTHEAATAPLHALAFALGAAAALAPRNGQAQRNAALDALLDRVEAFYAGNGDEDGVSLLPVALWQLLLATEDDVPRRARARRLVDELLVRGRTPTGLLGDVHMPVPAALGGPPVLEPRGALPASAAHAAFYLALLARHGRTPPPSLPLPPLPTPPFGCGCQTSGGPAGGPALAMGAALLARALFRAARRGGPPMRRVIHPRTSPYLLKPKLRRRRTAG